MVAIWVLVIGYAWAQVQLKDNNVQYDYVEKSQGIRYTFQVSSVNNPVKVIVSALSGDPDLYIAFNQTTPTKSKYELKGDGVGGEALIIPTTLLQKKCELQCEVQLFVFAKQEGEFVTIYHQLNGTPMFLELKTMFVDLNEIGDLSRFYTLYDGSGQIVIKIQSLSGDQQVFAKLYNKSSLGQDHANWPSLTPDTADYDQFTTSTTFELQVANKNICTDECVLLFGTKCLNEEGPCKYNITIQYDFYEIISIAVPIQGYIEKNRYAYYQFDCEKQDTTIQVLLTTNSGQDPDLCIGLGRKCTMEDYDWAASSIEGENIFIYSSDQRFKGKSMKGSYIIGVYGATSAFYTLVVKTDAQQPVRLFSGQPISGSTQDIDYYYFENQIRSDLTFSLLTTDGSCMYYINTQDIKFEEIYDRLPSGKDYIWTTTDESIQITTDDSNFCTNCHFIIGVSSYNCGYVITVSNKMFINTLNQGIPIEGQLSEKEWAYYSFDNSGDTEVDLDLLVYSGDADLYVGTEVVVSTQKYIWSSTGSSNEHISITKADNHYTDKMYQIGVYAFKPAQYSLIVSTPQQRIQLINGLSQTYMSGALNNSRVFQYTVHEPINIKCEITSLTELSFPKVYINTAPEGSYGMNPSQMNHEAAFDQPGLYDSILNMMEFNANHRSRGNILITVVADRQFVSYDLMCYEHFSAIRIGSSSRRYGLLDYVPHFQILKLQAEMRGELSVFVSSCVGQISFEIARDPDFEQKGIPELTKINSAPGTFQSILMNPKDVYYIKIKATHKSQVLNKIVFYVETRKLTQNSLQPPLGGKVKAQQNGKSIEIDWDPLKDYNGVPYSQYQTKYLVFLSQESYSEMSTVCGLQTLAHNQLATVINGVNEPHLNTEFTGKYVNIIGTVAGEVTYGKAAAYQMSKINEKEKEGGGDGMKVVLVLLVIVLVGSLGTFLYLKKRRRSVRGGYEPYIEVQDIRSQQISQMVIRNDFQQLIYQFDSSYSLGQELKLQMTAMAKQSEHFVQVLG